MNFRKMRVQKFVSVHSLSGLFSVTGPIDKDCLCFTHSFLPQEVNTANPMKLNWPGEKVNRVQLESAAWFQPHSNYCLDFHGDPHQSELAVYSDGNHHMALRYTRIFPDIFELVELPPGPDNLTTEYHAGVYEPGNSLAANLVDHLASKQTKSIYESHGLTGI